LAVVGWTSREGSLVLILVLSDGSRLWAPAAWTDLEGPVESVQAATLARVEDLLCARKVLEPLLARVVLADGDDSQKPSEETVCAATPRSLRESSAGGGAVGVVGRGAASGGDGASERADCSSVRAEGDRR